MRYLTDCACIFQNELYFFEYMNNALFSYNLNTKKFNYLGSIPNKKIGECGLFNRIFYYNEKLVLMPFFSNNICVYNLKTKKIIINNEKFNCDNSILINGKIYSYVHKKNENTMIEYDIDNNVVREISAFKTIESKNIVTDFSYYKGCIYFSYYSDNRIIEYNIANETIKYINIPRAVDKVFSGMRYAEGYFVVDINYQNALLFDENGVIINDYKLDIKKDSNDQLFHRQFYNKGLLILNFPYETNNIIIDLKCDGYIPTTIKELTDPVVFIENDEDYIVFPINSLKYVYSFLSQRKIEIDNEKLFLLMTKEFSSKEVIEENEWLSFKTFIESIR